MTSDLRHRFPFSLKCRSFRFCPDREQLIVFACGVLFLLFLERSFGYGEYIQEWKSDVMMQTVTAQSLDEHSWKMLWYLHIQPPALDFIRLIIVKAMPLQSDHEIGMALDVILYKVWAMVFGAQLMLMHTWFRYLFVGKARYFATLFWALHPSPIAYATLLDGTGLSSVLTTCFFYVLWKISRGGSSTGSVKALAVVTVALFLTRTIFQWYFLPVVIASVLLLRRSKREVVVFLMITLPFFGVYSLKQYLLFGTTSTTTFQGEHLCGMIWHTPSEDEIAAARKDIVFRYPEKAKALDVKFNSQAQYEINLLYTKVCKRQMVTHPIESMLVLLNTIRSSYSSLKLPSSTYVPNKVVDTYLARKPYNVIFSGNTFFVILFASATVYAFRQKSRCAASMLKGAALFLPWLYIVFIVTIPANRAGWIEASRLKYIIEPVTIVFICYQFSAFANILLERLCVVFGLRFTKFNRQ